MKAGEFIGENRNVIYSVILLIMIPILILANTFWQLKKSQDTINFDLKQKAVLANKMTSALLGNLPSSQTQSKINQLVKENQELKEVTVLKQVPGGFIVANSSSQEILGLTYQSADYTGAWASDSVSAQLITDTSKPAKETYWSIISPLKSNGEKIGLISTKLSITDTEEKNSKNLNNSFIVLAITITLVLLLLVNHFKFAQYAVLFRRLQEVDKMKDDFVSVASHELKTPMAAIKGYLSMMLEGIAGKYDEKGREHLLKINDNVARLDLLVSELLDLSRLEQQRMQFDMQPVDLASLVDQSIKSLSDQAAAKNLKIENQKVKLPQAFVDPDRFRQVIDNLLGNAIKYTLKGGVTVYYQIQGGNLLTIVKDTGIGMSESDKQKLFSKFYRIKNEQTVDIPGTGLGLWISREITKRMNGDITVKSKENVGSEFIISLPFIKE